MLPLVRAWRNRALVTALTRRELAARYRGGLLGYFWSLVNPLLLLAVYATVFRLVFAPRADVRPYALFLFIGVLAWGLCPGAGRLRRDLPRQRPAAAQDDRGAGGLSGVGRRGAPVAPGPRSPGARRGDSLLGFARERLAGSRRAGLSRGARAPGADGVRSRPGDLVARGAFRRRPRRHLQPADPRVFSDARPLPGGLGSGAVPGLFRANPFSTYFAALHDALFFFRPIPAVEWAWMAGTAALSLAAGGLVFERLRDSIAEEA